MPPLFVFYTFFNMVTVLWIVIVILNYGIRANALDEELMVKLRMLVASTAS